MFCVLVSQWWKKEMAAKLRIHLGAVQNLAEGVTKLRIHLGAVQVLWKDELYWGADFTTESSFEAALIVGEPPFPTMAPPMGRWTWPVTERFVFNTEIGQSHDRTEQRIAKRQGIPAHYVSTRLAVKDYAESARLDAVVHTWAKQSWRCPFWPDAERHAAALPAGTSTIAVDTRYSDFRTGFAQRWCMIYGSPTQFEFAQIASKTDDSLTLLSGLSNSYEPGQWIMPVRTGRLIDAAVLRRFPGGAGLIEMTWRIEDVQAISGFTPALTYDGYTVLTEPAVLPGDAGQFSHDPDVAVLESGNGPFEVVSNSDFNEVTQSHGWVCDGKAAAWRLRQFLHDAKGRQKAYLVPTFKEDLVLTRPVAANATTLYVANSDHLQMGLNTLRTYVAFRPEGGDLIVRKITGIGLVSATEEVLTIDATPEQAFTPGEALCWVDKCRLASDQIELTWSGIGQCSADMPLVRVTA
jgi:hypothetical protein